MALCVIYLQGHTEIQICTYLVGGWPLRVVAEADLEEGGDSESKRRLKLWRGGRGIEASALGAAGGVGGLLGAEADDRQGQRLPKDTGGVREYYDSCEEVLV